MFNQTNNDKCVSYKTHNNIMILTAVAVSCLFPVASSIVTKVADNSCTIDDGRREHYFLLAVVESIKKGKTNIC